MRDPHLDLQGRVHALLANFVDVVDQYVYLFLVEANEQNEPRLALETLADYLFEHQIKIDSDVLQEFRALASELTIQRRSLEGLG